jgi:glycosyltransferase involved in cell wall biosynthesis
MQEPLVTVVMPVRNEAGFIGRGLGSVLAQDYPSERLEVIVADGMSTDKTREVIKDLAGSHANVRVINNPRQIVATGFESCAPRSER